MIMEHQGYLDALEKRNSDLIYGLLRENLEKRAENIPYNSDAYFHEEV